MATIEEVAALAGVSIATVSRVMNNSYIVSQDKRERVLAAAAELKYQTNRSPVRPAENRLILIAGSVFIYDVVAGIQDKARESGYEVVFKFSTGQHQSLKSDGLLTRNQIDGIILLNYIGDEQELLDLSASLPVIQCGGSLQFIGGITVSINNERAAIDVVEHLVRLGRRRIALIQPAFASYKPYYMAEREKGYRMALQEQDCASDESLIFSCDLSPESIDDIVQNMLAMDSRPDAIFCVSDSLAAGIQNALIARGLSIPDDIAIVGFDNDDMTEWQRPPLSSINQPRYEIGCECFRLLHLQMKEENILGRHVMLAHNLIVRGSSQAT